MPLQVAVTIPPGLTVLGLSLRIAPVTVKEALVANLARPLLANSRSSYVPGATFGIVNGTLPLAAPVVPRQPSGEMSAVAAV
jgi:hypothetical protein